MTAHQHNQQVSERGVLRFAPALRVTGAEPVEGIPLRAVSPFRTAAITSRLHRIFVVSDGEPVQALMEHIASLVDNQPWWVFMWRSVSFPKSGKSREELRALMAEARRDDAAWRKGRVWSLVYDAGDDVLDVAKEAYTAFFSENGLGRLAFPSLARFEDEVVAATAALLNAPGAFGSITSGGSESILLAVKTARDRARAERSVTAPEIVLPLTAHPAFAKAAHYFGLKAIRTPVTEDFRADVNAMRAAVTERTALLVASAPQWPHGVIDSIPEIAAIAADRGLACHVDACLGGYFLPFMRKLGRPVPPFDFAVPGVTSMSADLHKYGFAAKGASVVLYRDESACRYQPFSYEWPGGRYVSPTMAGTRPGGAIAAAWAVMNYLGEEGYVKLVERALNAARALIAAIPAIGGLEVFGEPAMTVFGYGARGLDIFAIADALADRGWYVNRQSQPPGIHLKVDPAHEVIVDEYLADLRIARDDVAGGRTGRRTTEIRYA